MSRFDMGRSKGIWRRLACMAALLLSACGGGGGGGEPAPAAVRDPLPRLIQDIEPAGTRVDYRSRNYFRMAPDDQWTFDLTRSGVTTDRITTRRASPPYNSRINVSEFTFREETIRYDKLYEPVPQGLIAVLPFQYSNAARDLVGDILEFPQPFFAAGTTRRSIRQGNLGDDVDGDGFTDTFRVEYSQTFVGTETLVLPQSTLPEVARFRHVEELTIQPSDPKKPLITIVRREESWWAPDIGLVRAERSVTDSTGARTVAPYEITLKGALLAGEYVLQPLPDGKVTKVPLIHTGFVADPARARYYASIPSRIAGTGNRVAVIDSRSGAIVYPAPSPGLEPGPLALSADGNALYVGLQGTGDIVKLRLPEMTEIWRTRLPVTAFDGQTYAAQIAVSPADPDLIAVSLKGKQSSDNPAGLVLLRNAVVSAIWNPIGENAPLIAFDGNGRELYGFNNVSTELGLRRFAVLASGLKLEQYINRALDVFESALTWSPDGLVLGKVIFATPGLQRKGVAAVPVGACKPLVPGRFVCSNDAVPAGSGSTPTLAVVDATNFAVLSTAVYRRGDAVYSALRELVPGPAEQVAIRLDIDRFGDKEAEAVWLFDHPMLK